MYGNTFHQGMQYHAWTSFISDSMFCIRACYGFRASELCNNIYDEMGCEWVRSLLTHSLTHSFFSFPYTRSFSPPQNIEYRTCPATTNLASLKSVKAMMRMSFLSFLLFFFDSHSGESFRLPMGVYGTSTFHQGTPPTPVAHPAPSSSNCRTIPSITAGPVRAKRSLEKKFAPAFPKQTSPP